MRTRRHDKHLPRCGYQRHGAYWYVKEGKWTRLGDNLQSALAEHARILEPRTGGCDELLDRTLERAKGDVEEVHLPAVRPRLQEAQADPR
jgi:hypothetical protein